MTLVWRIGCVWVWFRTLEEPKMVENALFEKLIFGPDDVKIVSRFLQPWRDFAGRMFSDLWT